MWSTPASKEKLSLSASLLSGSKPFFLLSGLFGVSALAHPCPTCFIGTAGFFTRGAAEKVAPLKNWMDRRFRRPSS